MNAFSLESFRDVILDGYLIFTDAVETGEEINGCNFITSTTREGVHCALLNTGFQFIPEGGNPTQETYWMKRNGTERLRYHPIREKPMRIFAAAISSGLKTRIDFFCHERSNAAYDVMRELLELGYKVMTYDPNKRVIPTWYMIEPSEGAVPVIREIR